MGFSPKLVSGREWAGLVAGLVAFAALFAPWTNLSATRQDVEEALRELPAAEVARTAWTVGFLAWFGPLLLLFAGIAVTVFGQRRAARLSGLAQLWLIASAVAVLLMVLAWLAIDHEFGADTRALLADGGVGINGGIGRYLAMVAGGCSLVAAVLDARSLRRRGMTPKARRIS
ncbi:hypothetical protein [Amycolatopsis taiwanensis]|uniref:Uncharacterized protein n=1 Tax=Amycolatopsis taiwanensis TaxID=342230 RepID=A0A9W6R1Y5_9PSEU|nr:hypothetical protein [Amycolatopsis taiwanensis]GLY66928.1 hypothetical protein Atai01_35470 [Amycolatopsis taiwanensis]